VEGDFAMHMVSVRFFQCHQGRQAYGTDDEFMTAWLSLQIAVDRQLRGTFRSHVKQTVGGRYNTDPIEVGWPEGYEGPFDYDAFRGFAAQYYRGLVGQQHAAISLGNARNVMMENNSFIVPWVVSFLANREVRHW
jgi:hypothetical protein